MKKHKLSKRKLAILLAALLLIVGAEIGAVVAFVIDRTESKANVFTPGSVECQIVESVSNNVKSSITVLNPDNAGNTDVFVRVAVIANNLDADGNVIPGTPDISASLSGSVHGTGWIRIGDYYYYSASLKPGESTGNLLGGSISLTGKQVTVLAEAIQSEPADAAEEAWGVTVSGGAITGGASGGGSQ